MNRDLALLLVLGGLLVLPSSALAQAQKAAPAVGTPTSTTRTSSPAPRSTTAKAGTAKSSPKARTSPSTKGTAPASAKKAADCDTPARAAAAPPPPPSTDLFSPTVAPCAAAKP